MRVLEQKVIQDPVSFWGKHGSNIWYMVGTQFSMMENINEFKKGFFLPSPSKAQSLVFSTFPLGLKVTIYVL